jgi:beclin 1-associated autophagy-related key regulator
LVRLFISYTVSSIITYHFLNAFVSFSDTPSAAVEDDPQSTVSLLADARRTAYIKGRWVVTDSGYEQQYRIVVPTLPGSGNYSLASMLLE